MLSYGVLYIGGFVYCDCGLLVVRRYVVLYIGGFVFCDCGLLLFVGIGYRIRGFVYCDCRVLLCAGMVYCKLGVLCF